MPVDQVDKAKKIDVASKPLKRLLCIFHDYPPCNDVSAKRAKAIYHFLPKYNWQVSVITVPLGRSLENFENVHEVVNPRPSRLLKLFERLRLARLLWFVAYRYFWEPQVSWVEPVVRKAVKLAEKQPFDAILTSSYPYSTLAIGQKLQERLSIPWMADLRDFRAIPSGEVFPSKYHHQWMKQKEEGWLKTANAISVVSQNMKRELLHHYPSIDEGKVKVIFNGFEEKIFQQKKSDHTSQRTFYTITSVGTLFYKSPEESRESFLKRFANKIRSKLQFSCQVYDPTTMSPVNMFKALQLLKSEKPDVYKKLHLRLIGLLNQRNVDLAKDLGISDNVYFSETVSHQEALQEIIDADLLYLPMKKRLDGRPSVFMATRTYEYMASGNQILLIDDPGEVYDLLESMKCCKRFDFDDIRGLANYLISYVNGLRPMIKINKKQLKKYSRHSMATEFSMALDQLILETY